VCFDASAQTTVFSNFQTLQGESEAGSKSGPVPLSLKGEGGWLAVVGDIFRASVALQHHFDFPRE
jgi:hypothetical protein